MARLESPVEWDDLKLVAALRPPFSEAVRRVHDHVAPLLSTRPLGAEEYTDHDVRHAARVLERIGQLLPWGTSLNQAELYILTLAALLHDSGLWATKQETIALLEDADFQRHLGDSSEEELAKIKAFLADDRLRWMGELLLQRLAAAYYRHHHPERLATAVLAPGHEPGETLRVLIGEEYVDAVVAVSVAHSWTREQVLESDELRTRQFGDDAVCLRYLACALRMGDLLDLGDGRVSDLLWLYLAPLDPVSESHWRKERTLKLERCSPDELRVAGRFDVDRHGIAGAEAHRLAQDWLGMLRREIEGVALVLNSRMEPEFQKRLWFGKMALDIDRVTVNGLVLGGKVTFELAQSRVIELLSDEIYADRSVFIRELLQNAVDATRLQLIRDRRAGLVAVGQDLPESEPWNWPHAVTGDQRYEIKVDVNECHDAHGPHIDLSITDRGIGMSLANLRDHFLQVGKSFYTTSRYQQEFTHAPISQFGIGFLSCLTVADRIEVRTRQHREPSGLRLTLQKPSEHFIVEKDGSLDPGTTVHLRIAQRESESLGLQSFPQHGTYFFSDPSQFSDALAVIVSQWASYLEFPVVANGSRIEPKDPKTYVPDYVQREVPVESLPVSVVSEDGREIARGRVFYDVFEGTHLPSFHSVSPQTRTVASWRGIGLSDGRIDFTNHQVLVALDFRRLPPSAMTAGRSLRLGWTFFSSVGDRICHELRSLVTRELEKVGADAAVLWNLFLDRRIAPKPPAPDRFPIRTSEGVRWKSWEEIQRDHSRAVLVPYHVAWRGPWTGDVPAVGMTNEQLGSLKEGEDGESAGQAVLRCDLVTVPDTCSGYLWPPATSCEGLQPLDSEYTYTHTGLVKWASPEQPRRLADAIPIDERLVPEEDLPDYDHLGDPWRRLGAHQYSRVDDGSTTGNSAAELFRQHETWTLQGAEITVRVHDAENWK